MIALRLPGIPAGKGSYRAVRGRVLASSSTKHAAKLKLWHDTIKAACFKELRERLGSETGTVTPAFPSGAVALGVVFGFPLDAKHFRDDGTLRADVPWAKVTPPDSDKLVRQLADSLTSVGSVWRDDAQMAFVCAASVLLPPDRSIRTSVWLGAEVERYEVVGAWSTALGEAQAAMGDAIAEANVQRLARRGRKAA